MKLGDAVKEARKHKHLTQSELGSRTFISPQMVSAIETGRKGTTVETIRRLVEQLDDPMVVKALALEILGGVFVTPWLDGELVDLHRMSVKAKLDEEYAECDKALARFDMINHHRGVDHDKAIDVAVQIADLESNAEILLAIFCQECGLGPAEVYTKHRDKLWRRGYLRSA